MKNIVIDLDGTLLQKPGFNITDQDIRTIKWARSLGHKYGIATGRAKPEIEFLENKFNLESDYKFALNGMYSYFNGEDNIHTMDQSVIVYLMEAGIKFEAQDNISRYFTDQEGYDLIKNVLGTELYITDDFSSINVMKVVIRQFNNDIDVIGLYEELKSKGWDYNYFLINDNSIEIVDKKASKRNLVNEVMDLKSVVAIGDSYNDYELLSECDHGYLMNNAIDELKQKALNDGISLTDTVSGAILRAILEFKAAIFDLDGVITSTDAYHYKAWTKGIEPYGLTLSEADNERLKGITREQSLNVILEVNNKELSQEDFDKILCIKNELYLEYIEELTPSNLDNGVLELLDSLKAANVKIVLASSSKNAKTIINKLGIADYFDVIMDPTESEKNMLPDNMFVRSCEVLGLAHNQVVVFEDSPSSIDILNKYMMCSVSISNDIKHASLNCSDVVEFNKLSKEFYEKVC